MARGITEVISGRARGVDQAGESWALAAGIPVTTLEPLWGVHGRGAGLVRNEAMADQGDALLAFWDGESRGTLHMIRQMYQRDKSVSVVRQQWLIDYNPDLGKEDTDEE